MVSPVLLLDNFDSFTFNLADYFSQIGVNCQVERNDTELTKITNTNYSAIVLSPGPGKPIEAGIMMKVLEHFHDKIPILGICLGHQAIGEYFGTSVQKAIRPMHGKISAIICKEDPIFEDIPKKINVVRYHSLVLQELKGDLKGLAYTTENEVMILKHRHLPIYGIQYHPEAILTEYGKKILENWVKLNKIQG